MSDPIYEAQACEIAKMARSISALESENDNLRELVMEIWRELDDATRYEAGGVRGLVWEFADRMRELGVEVD